MDKLDILNALNRSGYLLENRILEVFLKSNYWSEANHKYKMHGVDEKFREIDIVATKCIDTYETGKEYESLSLYVHFFCECKNIPNPLAVFKSKGDMDKPTSDWSYKFTNGSDFLKEEASILWPYSINKYEAKIIKELPARQYCGFIEKKSGSKDEKWMAFHSDEFHNMLTSLVGYGKYKYKEIDMLWNEVKPSMARLDILIPLVVLQGEIIEISANEVIEIKDVNYYRLKMPYEESYNKSLSIDIVRESFLTEYLKQKVKVLKLMFNDLKLEMKKSYS